MRQLEDEEKEEEEILTESKMKNWGEECRNKVRQDRKKKLKSLRG